MSGGTQVLFLMLQLQIAIPRDVIETFGEVQSQEGVKAAFEIIYASTYAAYQHGFEGEMAVDYAYLQSLMTPQSWKQSSWKL